MVKSKIDYKARYALRWFYLVWLYCQIYLSLVPSGWGGGGQKQRQHPKGCTVATSMFSMFIQSMQTLALSVFL